MTALSAPADRPRRPGDRTEVGVAASTRIWQGAIVEIVGGYATAATSGASKSYFGVALRSADNRSGTAGALRIPVLRRGVVYMQYTAGHKPAIGAHAYLADDSTVDARSASASSLGRVVGADDDGVWVDMGDR